MAFLSAAVTTLLFVGLLYVLLEGPSWEDNEAAKGGFKFIGTVLLIMGVGALIGISSQSVLIVLGSLFLLFTAFVFTMRLRL